MCNLYLFSDRFGPDDDDDIERSKFFYLILSTLSVAAH